MEANIEDRIWKQLLGENEKDFIKRKRVEVLTSRWFRAVEYALVALIQLVAWIVAPVFLGSAMPRWLGPIIGVVATLGVLAVAPRIAWLVARVRVRTMRLTELEAFVRAVRADADAYIVEQLKTSGIILKNGRFMSAFEFLIENRYILEKGVDDLSALARQQAANRPSPIKEGDAGVKWAEPLERFGLLAQSSHSRFTRHLSEKGQEIATKGERQVAGLRAADEIMQRREIHP